jgi:hypothetical protein
MESQIKTAYDEALRLVGIAEQLRKSGVPATFTAKLRDLMYKDDVKGKSYHLADIVKGELGELSKVREEIEEAIDAEQQNCDIMVLVELSDVIGAIDMYLQRKHPTITLESLRVMSAITQRAFKSGGRT